MNRNRSPILARTNRRAGMRTTATLAFGGTAWFCCYRPQDQVASSPSPSRSIRRGSPLMASGVNPLWSDAQLDHLKRKLQQTDQACQAVAKTAVQPIRTVFDDARGGAGTFADTANGWSSRSRWCYDSLPWNRTQTHADFLSHSFRKHVLNRHDLETAIAQTATRWQHAIEDIENRLLVDLSADMRLFLRHGDDVADAVIQHGDLAVVLVVRHGCEAAAALTRLSSRNARRVDMLSREGVFTATTQSPLLWDRLIARGDEAADFVWRNKAALTSVTILAAFLADLDSFIDGLNTLAEPISEGLVESVCWPLTVLAWFVITAFVITAFGVMILRRRHHARSRLNDANLSLHEKSCPHPDPAAGPTPQ